MNIIDLLFKNIQENEHFFFNKNSKTQTRKIMKRLVNNYLKEQSEGERDLQAKKVINYALSPHHKGEQVSSYGDILNTMEVYDEYEHKGKNRKHLSHCVNTFLLGLLIYHNLHSFRSDIDREMNGSANKPLSGGDTYGEFLFRWRLASLIHDLGNGISLFNNNDEAIKEYIFKIMNRSEAELPNNSTLDIEYLCTLSRNKNALEELSKIDQSPRLINFFTKLRKEPYENIYYDHGMMSALIIIKTMDVIYQKYDGNEIIVDNHHVSFDRKFFDISIMNAAYAVCMHNFDFYPDAYHNNWPPKIYDIEKKPFAFLLKLADTLQEWNKVKASDESNYIDANEIEISFTTRSIIIEKYPQEKLSELKEKNNKYFNSNDILEFKK